jgi:hypothetical protein
MAQIRRILKDTWTVLVVVVWVLTALAVAVMVGAVVGDMMGDSVWGLLSGFLVAPAIINYVVLDAIRGKGKWKDIRYWWLMGIVTVMFIIFDRQRHASNWLVGRLSDAVALIAGGLAAYAWLVFLSYYAAGIEWLERVGVLKWMRRVVVVGCASAILFAGGWMAWMWNGTPVVTVDYLAKFNEMRMPADYRVEDDGAELFLKACSLVQKDALPCGIWPGDMNDMELGSLKVWLAANSGAFDALPEAIAKRCFWLKRTSKDGSMAEMETEYLDQARMLVIGLWRRGKLRAWEGDIDGCFDDLALAAATCRCSGESPDWREWGRGVRAVKGTNEVLREIMERTELSPEQLDFAAGIVDRSGQQVPSFERMMRVEDMAFRDTVQRYFTDNGQGDGHLILREVARRMARMVRRDNGSSREPSKGEKFAGIALSIEIGRNTEGRRATLERYDRMLSNTAEMSRVEPFRQDPNGRKRLESDFAFDFLSFISGASRLDNISGSYYRFRNDVTCTQGVVCILKYEADVGELPDGWEDVVKKGYFRSVPIDVYSGRPVIYRKVGDGFTVYSVGSDGVDNGGVLSDDAVFWPTWEAARTGRCGCN